MKKILCFFGTRPEAIKMAPMIWALERSSVFTPIVCVSGQHREMLDQVLELFNIKAHYDLDVMEENQSLFDVTTRALSRFEPVLKQEKPDMVLVHGDTTTTLAGALAAYYLQIPVGHVEAGLRTHDRYRPFPEEMNRTLVDSLSSIHFAPTASAKTNLLRQGLPSEHIYVTGNTVIDAFLWVAGRKHVFQNARLAKFMSILDKEDWIVFLTAHRRENFGRPFERVFRTLRKLTEVYPDVRWIYPVHPNPNVAEPVRKYLSDLKNVLLLPPLGYADTVHVVKRAHLVITDSGGLQEEAPSLGKPVLVLRDVTERPEAVDAGTVRLVGTDPERVEYEVRHLLDNVSRWRKMANATNPYGDGRAARRTVEAIRHFFRLRTKPPKPFEYKMDDRK